MNVWTITYDSGSGPVEKAVADWGLTAQPVIRTRDRSETIVSFRMAGADPAGAVPFAFRDKVIIKQNRTFAAGSWSGSGFVFTGYLTTQSGRVSGNNQGIRLDFADAIWLMKNTTFMQTWTQNNLVSGSVVTTSVPESRCILFMDITAYNASPWSLKSVQWQINEIITYAASCGIAIAAGTIDYSGWEINYCHVSAISCWDALLKCLEPVADAKVWIDGSTSTPTLHVRTRAALAALAAPTTTAPGPVTLPYKGSDSAGRRHVSSELVPRYDIVPPQVVLQYQTNNTINGQAAPNWASDVYPPASTGQVPFAMVVPIDLSGASYTTEKGQLDCETLACVGGTQASKRAWWASKRGGEQAKLADFRLRFQDATGAAVTIGDATVTDDSGAAINLSDYPRRLIAGTYHNWMKNGSTQINCIRAHVRVTVQLAEYDVVGSTPAETDTNGNVTRKSTSHEFHCHITLTNSPNGNTVYDGLGASGTAEIAASNLAQNIYNSRATLDYDGTHEIVDPGIPGSTIPLAQIIGHWNVLNLSGGATAWATAKMTIAGTTIDLMTNHQVIDIGPSKHLSPQDWNQMLQFFRNRRTFIFAGARATGYGGGTSQVDMARNTPDGNTVAGLTVESMASLIGQDAVDATRTNVFKQDSTTGQMVIVQQATSGGSVYTTGIVAAEYSGAGVPSASTLATNAYYRVGDKYFDTTGIALYRCTTAGSKSTSAWVEVSSSGGGGTLAEYKMVSDGGDYWNCNSWNGSSAGADIIRVYKPHKLRAGAGGITTETIRGRTQNYSYAPVAVGAVTGYYVRTITVGGNVIERDVLDPDVLIGDIICALSTPNLASQVTVAAVAAGGTSYTNGDLLTVVGGTGTAAVLKAVVSGGVIIGVTIADPGAYTVAPSNPVSVTGGTGSGATFNLTLAGGIMLVEPHLAWTEM